MDERGTVSGSGGVGWAGEGFSLGEPGSVPASLAARSLVAGYRLEEQVGAGGLAVVYRAWDE